MFEYINSFIILNLILVLYALGTKNKELGLFALFLLAVNIIFLLQDIHDVKKKKILFNNNVAFTCNADRPVIVKKDSGYKIASIYFTKGKELYAIKKCTLLNPHNKSNANKSKSHAKQL